MQLSPYADMSDLDNVYLTMADIREIAESDPDSHWFSSLKTWGVSERSLDTSVKRIAPSEYRFAVREYADYTQTTKAYRVFSAKLSVAYRGSSPDNLRPYWRISIEACNMPGEERTYFSSRKTADKYMPELVRAFQD